MERNSMTQGQSKIKGYMMKKYGITSNQFYVLSHLSNRDLKDLSTEEVQDRIKEIP